MRKINKKELPTAPKQFKILQKINILLANIVLGIITLFINIGDVFLWPFKHNKYIRNRTKIRLRAIFLFLKKRVHTVKKTTSVLSNARKIFLQKIYRLNSDWENKKSIFLLRIRNLLTKYQSKLKFFHKKQSPNKTGVIYTSRKLLFEKFKFFGYGITLTFFLAVIPITIFFWLSELPNPRLLSSRDIPLTTKIYDRNGILLYQIYDSQNRSYISLSSLPKNLINATLAIEDKKFYKHKGVDIFGIIRAALVNASTPNHNGRPLQGGSSITQQLIKNALLTSEPTLSRKIKEVVLAVWAEMIYSKDEILEMYFNQVPYGGTAWGVEAAAETYFKKKAKDLSLSESALIAGLPAAPSLYSPFGARPELAKDRQLEVLRRMTEDAYITKDEEKEARSARIRYASPSIEIKAPHFVMFVKDILVKKYGIKMVEQGGLNVTTSLDLNIQEMVEKEVEKEVEKLKTLLVGNGAALVTKPTTGEILAMVGSKDYFDIKNDGNVNVTISQRQPGSSIKPILYAVALQKGYTPSTIIDDSPVSYRVVGQPDYTPVNYDLKFHGRVTLRNALGNSFNIPAVKVLNSIGVGVMIEMGRKMGITTWEEENRYGLSLALGGGDVIMTDLAEAYGVFANQGKKSPLIAVLKTTDYKGNILDEVRFQDGDRVLSGNIAFQISNILADNNARSFAFGSNSALVIPGKTVSVKTGTTNEKRDNWTIGYTPSILVAVWVGNNDNSPMHPYLSSGITGAAPIWHNIMENVLKNKKDEGLNQTKDLIPVQICSLNGLLPCEGCPTITEFFIKGTEPKNHCFLTPSPSPTNNP